MVNGIDRAFYQIGTQFKFLWTEQQSKCFQLWQHHLSIMGTYFSQNFLGKCSYLLQFNFRTNISTIYLRDAVM